jgi:hypothetical protein
VRSVLVVVVAVDAENSLEMPSAEDQDPVEAVGANRAHPAFGVGVRVRRLDRRADNSDAFGPQDFVEGVAELRVVDAESERLLLTQCTTRLRACWATQSPYGFDVQAMNSIRRVASEMKNKT